MKKYLRRDVVFGLLFFLSVALFGVLNAHAGMALSPGMAAHTHSDANTGGGSLSPSSFSLAGSLSSSKACATGFVRIGPNFCWLSVASGSFAGNSVAGTCQSSAAVSGLTDAKAVVVDVHYTLQTSNAVGVRYVYPRFFRPTDSTCATIIFEATQQVKEQVAAAVGIFFESRGLFVVESSSTGVFKYAGFRSDANQSLGMYVVGYFD